MKNTNEILTIIEDEFIRLINLYNTWKNYGDYRAVTELVILCEEMEIPFDWKLGVNAKGDIDVIESITISGKRIEFDNYTRCRKAR